MEVKGKAIKMTSSSKRVLAGLRLSKDTDESTSIERQREDVTAWSASEGYVVIGESVDPGVSGAVSIHERPDLRDWLTGANLGKWDILAGARIERMSRDTEDFLRSARILNGKGKWLAAAKERVCLKGDGSASDQFQATILAASATMQRQRTAELCRESRDKLARLGRFAGGFPTFGYLPICLCHSARVCPLAPKSAGWTLIQGEHADTALEMAMRATAGDLNGRIARWLNHRGILTTRGHEWTPAVVGVLLRNPALAGYATRKGNRVHDDNGNDVMITDQPILTGEQWRKLQHALDSRKQKRAERVGGHMLLRVAYCRYCSTDDKQVPMYGHLAQGRTKTSIYRCQKCGYSVSMPKLESVVETRVLEEVGHSRLPRKVVTPAISHTAQLDGVTARIDDLDEQFASGGLPGVTYARMMTKLEAEKERLAALPQRAERIDWIPTETTVAKYWAMLDNEGRGAFLREFGVTIHADREGYRFESGWHDVDGMGSELAQAFGLAGPSEES